MLNPTRDKDEGKHRWGRRKDICGNGLSRRSLRVKKLLRVELESKTDIKRKKNEKSRTPIVTITTEFMPLARVTLYPAQKRRSNVFIWGSQRNKQSQGSAYREVDKPDGFMLLRHLLLGGRSREWLRAADIRSPARDSSSVAFVSDSWLSYNEQLAVKQKNSLPNKQQQYVLHTEQE